MQIIKKFVKFLSVEHIGLPSDLSSEASWPSVALCERGWRRRKLYAKDGEAEKTLLALVNDVFVMVKTGAQLVTIPA